MQPVTKESKKTLQLLRAVFHAISVLCLFVQRGGRSGTGARLFAQWLPPSVIHRDAECWSTRCRGTMWWSEWHRGLPIFTMIVSLSMIHRDVKSNIILLDRNFGCQNRRFLPGQDNCQEEWDRVHGCRILRLHCPRSVLDGFDIWEIGQIRPLWRCSTYPTTISPGLFRPMECFGR